MGTNAGDLSASAIREAGRVADRAIGLGARAAALLSLLVALPTFTLAQNDLYGPEAPRDSAYLRVINAREGDAVVPVIDGVAWDPIEFAAATPYGLVQPGERVVELAGEEVELALEPEGFTTLVALPEQTLVLKDTPLRDISRGLLTLYNLTSDSTIDLLTSDGTEVLAGVPAESAASIVISEATVSLAVQSQGATLAELPEKTYTRGEAHSIIVLPGDADPKVIYVRAEAEP